MNEEGRKWNVGQRESLFPKQTDKAGVKRLKVSFVPSKALRTMVSGISISTENRYVTPEGDGGSVTPPSGGGAELE